MHISEIDEVKQLKRKERKEGKRKKKKAKLKKTERRMKISQGPGVFKESDRRRVAYLVFSSLRKDMVSVRTST